MMTDDTDSDSTESAGEQGAIERRLDRLETQLEAQQETIESQQARIEEQAAIIEEQRDQLDDDVVVNRRTALKAGGLLGLVGLGAGTASADAQGSVGTSSDPLNKLYTEELNGGVTGEESLTNLAGSGLTIDGSGNLKTSGGSSTSKLETSGSTVTALEVLDGSSSVGASSDTATPPIVLGGHPSNSTGGSSVKGATIAGGGGDSGSSNDNTVSADWATVGGGNNNTASGTETTVGGGTGNTASGLYDTVAGGDGNTASSAVGHATVSGGNDNTAGGKGATVPGGEFGAAENNWSFVWNDQSKYHSVPNAGDGLSSSTAIDGEGVTGEKTFHASAENGFRLITGGSSSPSVVTVDDDGSSNARLQTWSGGLTVTTNDNGNLTLDPGGSSANTTKIKNRKSGSSSDNLLAVDGSNNLTESSKTVSDIGGGLEAPSGSSSGASFDTWTEVSSTRPAFVTASAAAQTNGTITARVKLAVDESGGTNVDYSVTLTQTASEHTDGTYHEGATSVLIPAGAQYQVENNSDPKGGNTLKEVRESIL